MWDLNQALFDFTVGTFNHATYTLWVVEEGYLGPSVYIVADIRVNYFGNIYL